MRAYILRAVQAPDRCTELRLQSTRGIVYADCEDFKLVARMNLQRQFMSPWRCRAGRSITKFAKFADALREPEVPDEIKGVNGSEELSNL